MMSGIKEKIEAANAAYVKTKGEAAHPKKKFAILTCMDARMDPVRFAGLADDAYVVRNAGGRVTDDAVRSLVVSAKLLGTTEWYVIHHTECGMAGFTNEEMQALMAESVGLAEHTEEGWRNVSDEPGADASFMDFMTIGDPEETLVDDVRRLRAHPLVSKKIPIYGYMYDIRTGALRECLRASAAGKAEP